MEKFFKFSIFSKFDEIIQGVSQRQCGDMRFGTIDDSMVTKNREHFLGDLGIDIHEVVVAGVTHGTKIQEVSRDDKGRGALSKSSAISATDGLLTFQQDVFLMVTVADCLPILIYEPVVKLVGILHAGWRGIISQIIPRAIEKFKTCGAMPEHLVIGIGPGICQKHFVVQNEVLDNFLDNYPTATFVRNNHGYVDLKKAAAKDFKKMGILEENLEIVSICPACDHGNFGSFRKEGEGTPASAGVIGMR